MVEFSQSVQAATSEAELETAVQLFLGETGLMQFVEFDQGMVVRKGTKGQSSRIIRLVIGNPLIMKEMDKHVPDAGSYAPVTVLVDERADACIFRMTGWLSETSGSFPGRTRLSRSHPEVGLSFSQISEDSSSTELSVFLLA